MISSKIACLCAALALSLSPCLADDDLPPFFGSDDDSLPANAQGTSQGSPLPPQPQPQPQPQQGQQGSILDGTWQAAKGQYSLILVFRQNQITVNRNGQIMQGTFQQAGNQLHITLGPSGQRLTWQFMATGNYLILNPGNIVLSRVPGATGGQAAPGQYPGSPASPGSGQGPAPAFVQLSGTWESSFQGKKIAFGFEGNRYAVYLMGRKAETGTYTYNAQNGEFRYQVLTGPSQGKNGVNRVLINGNQMQVTYLPDNVSLIFKRVR
ncbi:MAG: hypothetical protein K6A65_05250 [Succinivibrionaceae bacterium]|nr:hypothetical protein [Succinivibrionaceae bacterium]